MTLNRIHGSLLLFVGIAGATALAACGGAEGAPAKAPAGTAGAEPESTQREPTSVAEAQDQIARAKSDLELTEKKKAEGDKDSATSPGGGATPSTSPAAKPSVREESPKLSVQDSCGQSCKALSSMRRAVSALCRMTGDTDSRCADARKTLQDSESRVVATCHCNP
jgi:hypothetical protein